MGGNESKVETYVFSIRPGEVKHTQRADEAYRNELKRDVQRTKQQLKHIPSPPSSSPIRNASPKRGVPKSKNQERKVLEEITTESDAKSKKRKKKAKGIIAAQKALGQGFEFPLFKKKN